MGSLLVVAGASVGLCKRSDNPVVGWRWLGGCHGRCDDRANSFRRLDQMVVGNVGVARRRSVPPVPEQLADQREILARHDGLTGRRMTPISCTR